MTDITTSTQVNSDHLVSAPDGSLGYIVTIEQLLKMRDGRNTFFRKVSRSGKIQSAVYHGLQYDRSMRAYYAPDWNDISRDSGPLQKSSKVFIGFTY